MGFFFIQFSSEQAVEEFKTANAGKSYIGSEVLATWGQSAF
jgi:hypothetical protein